MKLASLCYLFVLYEILTPHPFWETRARNTSHCYRFADLFQGLMLQVRKKYEVNAHSQAAMSQFLIGVNVVCVVQHTSPSLLLNRTDKLLQLPFPSLWRKAQYRRSFKFFLDYHIYNSKSGKIPRALAWSRRSLEPKDCGPMCCIIISAYSVSQLDRGNAQVTITLLLTILRYSIMHTVTYHSDSY